jgi:3-deoxy-D-manno-octulosonate 8-phosphate phosphatase (KDO 8-P phosphatase)
MPRDLQAKARRIRALVLDVDGVLSDGRITYDSQGRELKSFSVRDGAAIKWLQRAGIEVSIITGRTSAPVKVRAKELGIKKVIQGALLKLPPFEAFLKKSGLSAEAVAYMGDDLLDLPILRRVGLSAAPADAVQEVLAEVDLVTEARSGRGAVRELAELLLKSQGHWAKLMERYQI